MKRFRIVSFTVMAGGVILLSACVTTPSGPGVMALPGTGKSFDQFRYDDATCRDYALALVGGRGSDQAATDAGLKSAAVGTVVGAVAGAAMGWACACVMSASVRGACGRSRRRASGRCGPPGTAGRSSPIRLLC